MKKTRVLFIRDDGTVLNEIERVVHDLDARHRGGTHYGADLARKAICFALRDRRFLRSIGASTKVPPP